MSAGSTVCKAVVYDELGGLGGFDHRSDTEPGLGRSRAEWWRAGELRLHGWVSYSRLYLPGSGGSLKPLKSHLAVHLLWPGLEVSLLLKAGY